MNLPDKCPFCGAGVRATGQGSDRTERWVGFDCFTQIFACDPHPTQSESCKDDERTRLAARVLDLEARCKRLEEALKECDRGFTKHCPDEWSTNGASWKAVREALGRPNPWEKSTP